MVLSLDRGALAAPAPADAVEPMPLVVLAPVAPELWPAAVVMLDPVVPELAPEVLPGAVVVLVPPRLELPL